MEQNREENEMRNITDPNQKGTKRIIEEDASSNHKRVKNDDATEELIEKPAYFDIYGPSAKPDIQLKLDKIKSSGSQICHIKTKDVQELLLWILSDGINPNWVFVKNKPLIKKVVLLAINSFDQNLFEQHEKDCFPFLSGLDKVLTIAPGSNTRVYNSVDILLTRPIKMTKAARKRASKKAKENSPPEPPSYYLLSRKEMKNNEYPLMDTSNHTITTNNNDNNNNNNHHNDNHTKQEESIPSGWMVTQPGIPLDKDRELLAIDCEMCITSNGFELTRVSIVDKHLATIYDKLVMPDNPIIDYNTRYSGIDAKVLHGVTTTLKDVQNDISRIIFAETILIGHSLENDLKALKMYHSRNIDTALLYPNPRGVGFKSALRFLVKQYLQRTIQADSHDSIADATAAMELALLKFQHGPTFGDVKEETESLFLSFKGQKCAMVDHVNMLKQYGSVGTVNTIPSASDEETFEKTLKIVQKSPEAFVWAQFHSLSAYYHQQANNHHNLKEAPTILQKIDSYVSRLYESAMPNTLFIITTCHGNMAQLKEKIEERNKRKLENPENWGDDDESQFHNHVESVRHALTFFKMKQ